MAFCIAAFQSAHESLSREAYEMAEKYQKASPDQTLSPEHVRVITDYINTQPLISKKIFMSLDLIVSLFWIALSILSFTGILPNVPLGGSIAMTTIGCINLILLSISQTNRSVTLTLGLQKKINKSKNFIDVLVDDRVKKHFYFFPIPTHT